MERREAVRALEEELTRCVRLSRRANCLLRDLLSDFFIYSDAPRGEEAIRRIREGYGCATVKAEIAEEILAQLCEALNVLLMV